MGRREHWEQVYETKGDADLSWFQARPRVSLGLLEGLGEGVRSVIDVGGGQSMLAGELAARGVERVCVVDISARALERARERVGEAGNGVEWVAADVLELPDVGTFDVWHDRAVFHFLTEREERERYVRALERTLRVGGHAIVGTFALTGPEKCSGLPVCRYDGARVGEEFGEGFAVAREAAETHVTPWGKAQDFAYAVLKRLK